MADKLKVEIWSDIMCPFCYIGKRKFEQALEQFEQKAEVEIIWKSFQLNPQQKDLPEVDMYDYLAEIKGQSREWSLQMHESVVRMAKGVGLDYNFDIAKISNSFDAHRVIQLAKANGLGDEIEERFFKAYFTEGALMSDPETLVRLATEVGLAEQEVRNVLSSNRYADAVGKDIAESRSLGVRGVPFFVLDRKYAVSGAQSPEVFLGALQQAHTAWRAENTVEEVNVEDGAACRPDGVCD